MISDASHDFKLSFAMQDLIIVLLISVGAAFVMLLQHRRARVHVDSNSATLDQTKPFRDMEHFDKDFVIPNGFSLSKTAPQFSQQIWKLLEFVVRDFIESWHNKIIMDNSEFPQDIRKILTYVLAAGASRASKIDWTAFVANRLFRSVRELLRIFRAAESNVLAEHPGYASASDLEKELLLMVELSRSFVLHPAMQTSEVQYLRRLSAALVSVILPPPLNRAPVTRSIVRELLANCVFKPTMNFVSPHFINIGITAGLRDPQRPDASHPVPEPSPESKESKAKDAAHSTSAVPKSQLKRHRASLEGGMPGLPATSGGLGAMFDIRSAVMEKRLMQRLPLSELKARHIFMPPTDSTEPSSSSAPTSSVQPVAAESAESADSFDSSKTPIRHRGQSQASSMQDAERGSIKKLISSLGLRQSQPAGASNSVLKSRALLRVLGTSGNVVVDTSADPVLALITKSPQRAAPLPLPAYSPEPQAAASPTVADIASAIDDDVPIEPIVRPRSVNSVSDSAAPRNNGSMSPVATAISNAHESPLRPRSLESQALSPVRRPGTQSFNWSVYITRALTSFDPKPFVLYELQVSRGSSKWRLMKRYSQFEDLHEALVAECERGSDSGFFLENLTSSSTSNQFKITASLPPKKMFGNMEKAFIEQRRVDLQQYLHSLMMQRPVLESKALAEFLRQQDNASSDDVSRRATLAADSPELDDSATESETSTIRRVLSMDQSKRSVKFDESTEHEESVSSATPRPKSMPNQSSSKSKLASQPSSEPTTEENPEQSASNSEEHNFTRSNLTAPLYDLLSEVLELPDSSTHGWFRKGVAWMATQVVEVAFGGSINDFLYNRIEGLANDQQMANLIDLVNRNIWPNGVFFKNTGKPATHGPLPHELQAKREAAHRCLMALVQDPNSPVQKYTTMFGRDYVESGIFKLFQFAQIEPLIKHLGYTALDMIFIELFPELEATIAHFKQVDTPAGAQPDAEVPASEIRPAEEAKPVFFAPQAAPQADVPITNPDFVVLTPQHYSNRQRAESSGWLGFFRSPSLMAREQAEKASDNSESGFSFFDSFSISSLFNFDDAPSASSSDDRAPVRPAQRPMVRFNRF